MDPPKLSTFDASSKIIYSIWSLKKLSTFDASSKIIYSRWILQKYLHLMHPPKWFTVDATLKNYLHLMHPSKWFTVDGSSKIIYIWCILQNNPNLGILPKWSIVFRRAYWCKPYWIWRPYLIKICGMLDQSIHIDDLALIQMPKLTSRNNL